jgi:hypothetical protein
MRLLRAILGVLSVAGTGWAGEAPLDGLFAVTARLELPHVERWAVDRTQVVCLGRPGSALPVPVLRAPGFARCAARDLVRREAELAYAIACPGPDAPRARAAYRLGPDGFRGRIAIVLGAKNMTMTEVQVGRRIGRCAPPAPSAGAAEQQLGGEAGEDAGEQPVDRP